MQPSAAATHRVKLSVNSAVDALGGRVKQGGGGEPFYAAKHVPQKVGIQVGMEGGRVQAPTIRAPAPRQGKNLSALVTAIGPGVLSPSLSRIGEKSSPTRAKS